MVLWDNGTSSDILRKIIGLSVSGGVAVYSGNDETTGSGIQLNAKTAATDPGLVKTISYGSTGAAYKHVNYNGTSTTSLFIINKNANTRIGTFGNPTANDKLTVDGNIYLNAFDNADATARNITAQSLAGSLNIYSGNDATGGSGLQLIARGAATDPGAFKSFSYGNTATEISFKHSSFDPAAPLLTAYKALFTINKDGNSRIGSFGSPTPFDKLTVDGDIYINSRNNTDVTYRNIFARSAQAGINITSGSNTDGTDGACFTANAWNVPYVSLATSPGAFFVKSWGGTTGNFSPLGYAYQNWDAGSSNLRNIFLIHKNGSGIFGLDVDLTNIVPGDAFTVKSILGFYSPVDDAYARGVHGNSLTGGLMLYANHDFNTGAGLELWAENNTSYPSQTHFLTSGSTGVGYSFQNVGLHRTYMDIRKDGIVVIAGPGLNTSDLPISTTNTYGLYVGKGILTEQVRVSLHTSLEWSDYVFADDYELMPLGKVKRYIEKNKHLPDVPSADEVVKDGIDLAKMDSKLLQKIEELTLYVIQQDKRIDELQKQLDANTRK